LFLDGDVLVMQSLKPIFDMISKYPNDKILICEDFYRTEDFGEICKSIVYERDLSDMDYLLQRSSEKEQAYKYVVNTGVLAGTKNAFTKLYKTITSFYDLVGWADKGGNYREQFIVNLALAVDDSAVLIDPTYNYQLHNPTTLRYDLSDDNQYVTKVGYSLFFLDCIKNPYAIADKLKDKEDLMSSYILTKMSKESLDVLEGITESITKYECAKRLEYIFNSLIHDLFLFDKEFLKGIDEDLFGDLLDELGDQKLGLEAIKNNKKILERYYIPAKGRQKDFSGQIINIMHFNATCKEYGGNRSFICNHILNKKLNCNYEKMAEYDKQIKIDVSTHKKFQNITISKLLHSLVEVNNVPKENILIVSGGWDKNSQYIRDGIEYHNVSHNSFDYTGIIDIVDKNLESEYWFLMHDTCELGVNFYNYIHNFDKSSEYVAVDINGFLNMGLFSWDFIVNNRNYFMRMRNCGKGRAILAEKMLLRLGKSSCYNKNQSQFLAYGDVYNTGQMRNMFYYEGTDLYKYQANISEKFRVTSL
jgi:hypothetical protein